MLPIKTFATATLLTFAAATANATVIDFTTTSTFWSISAAGAEGAVDGIPYTITTNPAGNLTFAESNVGTTCAGNGLACEFDGLGVIDDEISTTKRFTQSIVVAFDGIVTVTGLYFLDLFVAPGKTDFEDALVSVDGGPAVDFQGVEVFGGNRSGFLFAGGLSLTGSVFTFTAGITNDDRGVADYALAGIEIAPVPLPAGLLLLGGALGALGIARRRKAA